MITILSIIALLTTSTFILAILLLAFNVALAIVVAPTILFYTIAFKAIKRLIKGNKTPTQAPQAPQAPQAVKAPQAPQAVKATFNKSVLYINKAFKSILNHLQQLIRHIVSLINRIIFNLKLKALNQIIKTL